jgi:hypothetical protein
MLASGRLVAALQDDLICTRHDVLALGFEAWIVGPDGTLYLWHGESGLHVDPHTGRTTLLTDPAGLPPGLWSPTRLGLDELDEAQSREWSPEEAGEIASPPAEAAKRGTQAGRG